MFLLISLMAAALVNPGYLGSIDPHRRLQVARWFRLGQPPVLETEASQGFGIVGRNGVRHAWYGMGQSLVMVPFDVLAGAAASAVVRQFHLDFAKQAQLQELLVAFFMQTCVTMCVLLLVYEILRGFGFSHAAGIAGSLSVLFATIYLQYVQCAQENNLLFLLALCGLSAIQRWHRSGHVVWAVAAGASGAAALLVRLPSGMEAAVFLLFGLSLGGRRLRFLAGYLPSLAVGMFLDRWYHWFRFGEWSSTYLSMLSRPGKPGDPPVIPPFPNPFWKGFFGTLFSPDKSVLLFDPLLIVLLIVVVSAWPRIRRPIRKVLLFLAILLFGYICFYAKYSGFGGDAAWGHRFVTMPVQLLCLFAVPLLIEALPDLSVLRRRLAWSLVCASIVLQAVSTTLCPNLEIEQRRHGWDKGVVVNRLINLKQLALGQDSPRLQVVPVEWRSLYYFPFQLRIHYPQLAPPVIAAWLVLLACLAALVCATLRTAIREQHGLDSRRDLQ